MNNNHSVLPPSSAARRMVCAGSRALEAQYPQAEDTAQAREGHAAHWVAQQYVYVQNYFSTLEMAQAPKEFNVEQFLTKTTHTPNGELITQEMLEGARLYSQDILSIVPKNSLRSNRCGIEQRLVINNIHESCYGTPDLWYYDDKHLYIWDYKFGFGQVDAFENWQLIEYAAGILAHVKTLEPEYDDLNTFVTFRIVQPRPYGRIDEWIIVASHLRPYFNRLEFAEHAAMQPEARCTPEPTGCKDCSGRHVCEALQRAALSAIDLSTSNTPVDLTPEQLGSELRALQRASKLLEARRTGLEAQALAEIKSGKRVPGFALAEGRRYECWNKPIEEVLALGSIYGVNLAKPATPITPKQALDAGVPKEIIGGYSHRPAGEMKLVAEDLKNTRKIFGGQ